LSSSFLFQVLLYNLENIKFKFELFIFVHYKEIIWTMAYFSTIVLEIMLRKETDEKKKRNIIRMIQKIVQSEGSKH
tara:strand:+ start:220 stop:447 length:228 start_codon:yes stop_codon:yes gene_type:complete